MPLWSVFIPGLDSSAPSHGRPIIVGLCFPLEGDPFRCVLSRFLISLVASFGVVSFLLGSHVLTISFDALVLFWTFVAC